MAAILPALSFGAGLVGSGLSAYSSYQQGKAQSAMAYRNAKISDMAASNEAMTAAENAKRQRESNRQKLASVRARMAGSGVAPTGSSLDTIGTAASNLELSTMDLFRESQARQTQLYNDAAVTRWEGDQAMQSGKINAIGSLIGGAASAGEAAYNFKKNGVLRAGTV